MKITQSVKSLYMNKIIKSIQIFNQKQTDCLSLCTMIQVIHTVVHTVF